MDIAPIKTRRDYRRTLKAIEGLMSAKRNTPEGDRLEVLVTLVEAFERKHFPLDLPDPVHPLPPPVPFTIWTLTASFPLGVKWLDSRAVRRV
jgi:antitoxin component HigA of HigAB toxin-antitoxin module